jgi:hypothetical protein
MAASLSLRKCVAIFRADGKLYNYADSPRGLATHLTTLKSAGEQAVQVVGQLNGIRYQGVALIDNLLPH